jgi:hypothetical protein
MQDFLHQINNRARLLCVRTRKARIVISFALLVSLQPNVHAQHEVLKNPIDLSTRSDLKELLGASVQPGRRFFLLLELPDKNGLVEGQILVIRAEGDDICVQTINCVTYFFYRFDSASSWSMASSILPPPTHFSHEEYFFEKRPYRLLIFGRGDRSKFAFLSGRNILISDYQNIPR